MMATLTELLQVYVTSLRTGLTRVSEPTGLSSYGARLAAAGEMQEALAQGALGRVSSILYSEGRAIGWHNLPGDDGAAAHAAFNAFADAVTAARLRDAPDTAY
jgi:hypothetical protein